MNTPEHAKSDREKFEAWRDSNGICYEGYDALAFEAWQADIATRDEEHDSLVGMLEEKIARLKEQTERYFDAESSAKLIEQLQAQVAMLSDALNDTDDIHAALSAPPSNWLERKLIEARIDDLDTLQKEALLDKWIGQGTDKFAVSILNKKIKLRNQLAALGGERAQQGVE